MARTRLLALCAVSAASAFAPRPYVGVTAASRRAPASTVVMMGTAKNGIFSPIVRLAKRLVGKERFLSFRGRVIGSAQTKLCALDATPDRWRGGVSDSLVDLRTGDRRAHEGDPSFRRHERLAVRLPGP